VTTVQADSQSLKITDAWVPGLEKAGGDIPLMVTIHNESGSPDALIRVRCLLQISRKRTRSIAAKEHRDARD